jgi:polysaccharide export outer membrane protein
MVSKKNGGKGTAMKNTILVVLACGLVVGTAQASSEKSGAKSKKDGAKGSQVHAAPVVALVAADDPTYKIGAEDILKIDVWREDQLTRTVPVRPDGRITLPLLNDMRATGLTPMELAGAIRDELKNFVNNPQVTVSVMEINSRRIYVTGEVAKSGAFGLLPHMTALQAISSTGGFTQFARPKNIYILRTEQGKQVKLPFNYKEALKGHNPEQNIELQPGDVIVVP